MANAASSQGQVQRAGVTRLITDKRGKKKREAHDPNWAMRQKKMHRKMEGGPGSGRHGGNRDALQVKGRTILDKIGKKQHEAKRRRVFESSFGSPFTEKGQADKQKQPGGGVAKGRVYLVTIIEEG